MRIALLLSALLLNLPALAGPAMWTSAGPDGGGLSHLATSAASPSTVYTASGFALFRSTDSGVSWSRRAGSQDLGYINDVVVSPANADVVYLQVDSGVLRSDNGGASFAAVNSGLPTAANFFTRDLEMRPDAPDTLVLTSASHGAFRTSNGGTSWSAIGTGTLPNELSMAAFDPVDPQRLLISPCQPAEGSLYNGAALYRSADGGNSFTPATVIGGAPNDATCASAMSWNPDSPGVALVVAGFGPYQPLFGYLRSTDGGVSFSRLSAGPTVFFARFGFVPGAPAQVLGASTRGIHQISSDGGATFTPATSGPTLPLPSPFLEGHLILPKPGQPSVRYFISRGAGFFRSADSGATWVASGPGVRAVNVRAIAVNPVIPASVYAGQGESEGSVITWPFFRSLDATSTWTAAGNTQDADWFRTLLIDSNTAGTPASTVIYGGGRDVGPVRPLAQRASGVAKSSDNGNTWAALNNFVGLGPTAPRPPVATLGTVRSIIADRSVVTGGVWSKLYLTASGNGTCTAVGATPVVSTPRLWRTLDAGTSWDTISSAGSATAPGADGLPAGECVNVGTVADPFPAADFPIPVPLVVDHADPQTLYVGTYLRTFASSSTYIPGTPNGVFKSSNGGQSWTEVSNGLPLQTGSSTAHYSVLALAMDPGNRNVLYAAANPFFDNSAFVGNVYKTTNGGSSWAVAGTGLAGQDIRALLVDPDNSLRIYAASGGSALNPGGVFVSEDGGASWSSISAGLPLTSATALALDNSVAETPTLYAGTRTGLFAYTRVPDGDGDGAPSSTESGAPNSGDGDGDGMPDSSQSSVASLGATVSSTRAPRPFTVSITPLSGVCQRLYDVIAVPADTFASDPTLQKPDGAFRFEIANCSSARVNLKIHGGSFNARSLVRALGARIQGDPLSIDWNSLPATVGGDTISFVLTDNQPGDARQDSNRILFQGGPAFELPLFGNGFE